MIKFHKIKAGMRLFDYHSVRAGNTTYRVWDNWPVDVKSVREDGAVVSWNYNREEFWPVRRLEKLRAKPGKVRDPFARLTPR